ncbi:MAG: DinB family protein [Acidobacteria bacterium]|jgi:hypothetical protein|nr:DinB family protein [Acidobacteriota bacterium]
MTYYSIDEILAANEAALESFQPAVTGLSADQESFRPAADRWSIAEIAEHVALVNRNFLRIVSRLHQQALEQGAGPAQPIAQPQLLAVADPNRERRVEAPERVRPVGAQPIADSLIGMQETARAFREIQPQLEAVDLSGPTFPHRLGELNACQWLVLLGEHQTRHLDQIAEVKASPGYPQN